MRRGYAADCSGSLPSKEGRSISVLGYNLYTYWSLRWLISLGYRLNHGWVAGGVLIMSHTYISRAGLNVESRSRNEACWLSHRKLDLTIDTSH